MNHAWIDWRGKTSVIIIIIIVFESLDTSPCFLRTISFSISQFFFFCHFTSIFSFDQFQMRLWIRRRRERRERKRKRIKMMEKNDQISLEGVSISMRWSLRLITSRHWRIFSNLIEIKFCHRNLAKNHYETSIETHIEVVRQDEWPFRVGCLLFPSLLSVDRQRKKNGLSSSTIRRQQRAPLRTAMR